MERSALRHPALARLLPSVQKLALQRVQVMDLPAGYRIIGPGEACPGLPLVLDGSVRVQMVGASGNEIVLYRIGADDLCTLSVGCLIAERPFQAEALVEEPTRVALLPAGLFDQLMESSGSFRRYILASYGGRLAELMLLVEEIAFRRMDQRLAACLLARARDGVVEATHQVLAVELGTAREVVSRLLKEFERADIVRLERGRVELLALERLRDTAGEELPQGGVRGPNSW